MGEGARHPAVGDVGSASREASGFVKPPPPSTNSFMLSSMLRSKSHPPPPPPPTPPPPPPMTPLTVCPYGESTPPPPPPPPPPEAEPTESRRLFAHSVPPPPPPPEAEPTESRNDARPCGDRSRICALCGTGALCSRCSDHACIADDDCPCGDIKGCSSFCCTCALCCCCCCRAVTAQVQMKTNI
jgi:hypothetical protein